MSEIIDYCTGGIITVPNEETALTQNVTIQGDLFSGADGAAALLKQSRAGTFTRLRVLVLEHTRGDALVKLVRGGVIQPNPTLQISFDDNDTFPQLFEDTTHSVALQAGSEYRYAITLEKATGVTKLSYVSMQVEFDE